MGGKEIKTALGKNIKFLRFRKHYSQADLAEKADISITFLSNIERGLKFPKPDILSQIAEGLEVKVYELFKTDIVPDESIVLINCLSEDITQKVNRAIEGVFNQYLPRCKAGAHIPTTLDNAPLHKLPPQTDCGLVAEKSKT